MMRQTRGMRSRWCCTSIVVVRRQPPRVVAHAKRRMGSAVHRRSMPGCTRPAALRPRAIRRRGLAHIRHLPNRRASAPPVLASLPAGQLPLVRRGSSDSCIASFDELVAASRKRVCGSHAARAIHPSIHATQGEGLSAHLSETQLSELHAYAALIQGPLAQAIVCPCPHCALADRGRSSSCGASQRTSPSAPRSSTATPHTRFRSITS